MKRKIVGPSIHLYQAFGQGALNLVVPAGEIWELLSIRGSFVTADHNLIVDIDGRHMLWGPAEATANMFGCGETIEDYRTRAASVEHAERMIPVRVMEHQTLQIYSDDLSGYLWLWYRIYTLESGLQITDDGFTNGRNRTLHTWGYSDIVVPASATVEARIFIPLNPPGTIRFPWDENAPAQRDYELLSFLNFTSDAPIGQTYPVNLRILHEGRDIISVAGRPTLPNDEEDFTTVNRHTYFPLPSYIVEQYENLEVLATFGNGPAQQETVHARYGFVMIEREKKEIYP